MKSPSMQESLLSPTPECNVSPKLKVSRQNCAVDGWRETGWLLKHEQDQLAGYLFDPEPLREGSD